LADELLPVDGLAYTYDANGNLINDGQRTYAWDAENRLVEVLDATTGEVIASFTYDGLGRRLSQSTAQGTTYYHHSGDKVAYETDEAGNVTLMFSYDSAGLPLTMRYQGQTYYYHTNDRGDVLKITDGLGKCGGLVPL
jgi:YD repeat-containing protein